MVLNPDFKEFLQLLNEYEVRYMVVGGYAVAFHGYPRYTGDLDIWLWVDATNADKIVHVLQIFGFSAIGLSEQDFLDPSNVIQLGYPPVRIDLAMSISGIEFEDCFKRKITAEVDGVFIPFISLEDLKINKRATGRKKDLDDIENLE